MQQRLLKGQICYSLQLVDSEVWIQDYFCFWLSFEPTFTIKQKDNCFSSLWLKNWPAQMQSAEALKFATASPNMNSISLNDDTSR